MSFLKFLHGIGDRLGILEAVPSAEAAPAARIQTRSLTLTELSSEIRSGEVESLAHTGSKLTFDFEKIFERAGVPKGPESGIERLKQLVSSESSRGGSKEDVKKAIVEILTSEGIIIEEVVKEALARDKALDQFEAFAGEKVRKLQQEAAELNSQLGEWRKRKRVHEQELATIVGYVVDHPVITTEHIDD